MIKYKTFAVFILFLKTNKNKTYINTWYLFLVFFTEMHGENILFKLFFKMPRFLLENLHFTLWKNNKSFYKNIYFTVAKDKRFLFKAFEMNFWIQKNKRVENIFFNFAQVNYMLYCIIFSELNYYKILFLLIFMHKQIYFLFSLFPTFFFNIFRAVW